MTPFLITGCGRSGTRFMADLLTANGVPCGWEAAVNPLYPERSAVGYLETLAAMKLDGDSNWLAVHYLPEIPEAVRVVHQVRHPLRVVRSLLALRFFGDDYLFRDAWQGDPRHTGLVAGEFRKLAKQPTALERCLFYWVHWNRLCEARCRVRGRWPYAWYRFEDVLEADALPEVWDLVTTGQPVPAQLATPENVHRIFGDAPETLKHRLTWDDVPGGSLKDEARRLAVVYGYD